MVEKQEGAVRSRFVGTAWLVLGLATLVGCSDDNGVTDPPGQAEDVEITMGAITFNSDDVTIEPGQTVRWNNTSDRFHTVTPEGHSEWSSANVAAGEDFEHTFDTEGEFEYFCQPHVDQGMTGVIRVEN